MKQFVGGDPTSPVLVMAPRGNTNDPQGPNKINLYVSIILQATVTPREVVIDRQLGWSVFFIQKSACSETEFADVAICTQNRKIALAYWEKTKKACLS